MQLGHEPGTPLFFPAPSMPYLICEAAHTDTLMRIQTCRAQAHGDGHLSSRRAALVSCMLCGNAPGTNHSGSEPRLSRGPSRQSRVPRLADSFDSTCALLFLSEAQVSQNLTAAAHPPCNLHPASCIQRARHPSPRHLRRLHRNGSDGFAGIRSYRRP